MQTDSTASGALGGRATGAEWGRHASCHWRRGAGRVPVLLGGLLVWLASRTAAELPYLAGPTSRAIPVVFWLEMDNNESMTDHMIQWLTARASLVVLKACEYERNRKLG